MISECSRRCVAAFDRVQAIHRRRTVAHAAAAREIARVAKMSRTFVEEIRIERDDDVRFRQVVMNIDVISERELRAFAHVVAIHRFPLMPLNAGIEREELLDLIAERRRRDRLRENSKSGAIRLRRGEHWLQRGDELAPRRGVAESANDLRAIRIVQAEDRRLHERISSTE